MELLVFLPYVFGAIGFIVVMSILMSGYVKAAPDEAIIISGFKREKRIITGKAGIKVPFLERMDRLPLSIMKIDVQTSDSVPTNEFINVKVDAVVTVKISSDPEILNLACENFLNRDSDYIVSMVRDVLEGNIREIVGTMTLTEMVSDRQEFNKRVQENAVPDMRKMGIEIVSFNVQNFSDENNTIQDLGIDNTMKIKKNAAISKTAAEKEIEIAKAEAKKLTNDAHVQADTEIAIKNNELEIKKAQLKVESESAKAQADASYEIQKEAQRRTIEVAGAEADIARQEKQITISEQEISLSKQRLEAELVNKSEAEKNAAMQRADAELYERQKKAEAERIEIEQQAMADRTKAEADKFVAEQKAEAEKARMIKESEGQKAKALAEAEAIRAQALAEAEGIKAKLLAEAEGIQKKAEAMQAMGQAAVLEMYFNALPAIAENVAKPLNNVESITMYGEGNSAKMISDITNSMSQVMKGVTEGTGIDMQSVLAGFLGGKIADSANGRKG